MLRLANLKVLLALALSLRLGFLLLAGVNAPLVGDELAYQQIAANVSAGRGFVQDNNPFFPGQALYAWQAPLYPLSLAALYFFSGPHPIAGKLFGVLIGVATVYVTFDLAARIFSTISPAEEIPSPDLSAKRDSLLPKKAKDHVPWLAALFVAVYPGLLTSAHLLLSETLFTFLLVLAFDLIVAAASGQIKGGKPGVLLATAGGALWGAATLTRGITLYFALPLALWLAVDWGPRTLSGREMLSLKSRRRTFEFKPKMGIVFLLAVAVVMAPWTIRNMTVFGQLVLLETKGGVNFWLGNSPLTPDDFIRNVWKTGVREPMLAALPAGEIERDRAGYGLGEAFVGKEPLTFLARMPVKFADFWGFERNLVDAAEATRNGKAGGWNSLSKIAADLVSDVAYVLLIVLGVAGLVFAPGAKWRALIGGFVAYFVIAHMVVFGDGRFHLPLIPFFALYAAWYFLNLKKRLNWRGVRGVIVFACELVLAGVWAHEIVAAWGELRGGL